MLISVGRLSRQKAFADLITAFTTVRQKYPTAVLVIVGGGQTRAELVAQIQSLGLEGHVFLLGFRNDVPALLAASDLFVSSSHWEGIPIAILEAMSAGLPVVATEVGDVPLIVNEASGFIVPPAQPMRLADAITTLLADPDQRRKMGAAARLHVLQNYSPEVWAGKLCDLYLEVKSQFRSCYVHPGQVPPLPCFGDSAQSESAGQ
jgi:glycosyltransferase involved in cell wall biosynthesis